MYKIVGCLTWCVWYCSLAVRWTWPGRLTGTNSCTICSASPSKSGNCNGTCSQQSIISVATSNQQLHCMLRLSFQNRQLQWHLQSTKHHQCRNVQSTAALYAPPLLPNQATAMAPAIHKASSVSQCLSTAERSYKKNFHFVAKIKGASS